MSDERYDQSADMRLLDLHREALGLPRHTIASTYYDDPDPLLDVSQDEIEVYVQSGTVLVATIDAQPRAALIPGTLVTVSLSVSNDGDVPGRGVHMSLALPTGAAYRPGSLSIDGARGTDEIAHGLLENGADLGIIGPGARRTLTLKLVVEPGTNDIMLSPHLRAQSGAVLGLRAMRLPRKASSHRGAVLERPFYESDDSEHALESVEAAPPPPKIAVLQPGEYPPVVRAVQQVEAAAPVVIERVEEPGPEPVTTAIIENMLAKSPVAQTATAQTPARLSAFVPELLATRADDVPLVRSVAEVIAEKSPAPLAQSPAESIAQRTAGRVAQFVADAIAKRAEEQAKQNMVAPATPNSPPAVPATPLTVQTAKRKAPAVAKSVSGTITKRASEQIVKPVSRASPKRVPPTASKTNVKTTTTHSKEPAVRGAAITKRLSTTKQKIDPPGKAKQPKSVPSKLAVVRSVEDRIALAGQGGPILAVQIDRKRLATLTGLFSGASLGMIAHYLFLNALAAREALPGDGTDDSIAEFVASQEHILSRALISMRLGKTPTSESLGATLPAFPPQLATHADRRAIEAPPPGKTMLLRAFQPAEILFIRRMLSNEKATPFMRAAQLFVGLCANDAAIADDQARRRASIALTTYAALATAEISRIFLRAKLSSAPALFKATDAAFDDAARSVLAAIAPSTA